jgi:hypothetical protein
MTYHEGETWTEIVLYFPHDNTILRRCSYLRDAFWPSIACKISQYESDMAYPTKRSKNQVLQFRNVLVIVSV